MNTFFLFFLPLTLTWALVNETKSIAPFTVHKTVDIKNYISGLATNGSSIIATIPGRNPPFQDILSGAEYNAEKVGFEVSKLLFVSQDKAYTVGPDVYKLVEYNRQDGLLKPTVINSSHHYTTIALGNDKRVFVGSLVGTPFTAGVKSVISTYKDGVFNKLRELDGHLTTFTLSPDNKKIYGIIVFYTGRYTKELIEISLNDNGTYYKVIARAYSNAEVRNDVKCDKQGNIYVNWKYKVIEVYNPQGKTYPITSDYEIFHIAISNSEPQYLYVGGIDSDSDNDPPAFGRYELQHLIL
ncbi:hypothetical protein DSO57_1021297 [Entomophthora muscae]|uniref:Uncharacterized protein n=1 Tax=Entomophthora muscae TaxID=34485 RepID=A0ACC2TR44_9FUNG|nr:hypothetical protein DSO57_1021297 [Entomophthora muscae]